MNYEDLRKVQRLGKASSKLIEVEKNFFFELENFLKELESKAKSMEGVKLLENARKIARDIYERREQKVVVRAIRAARTGDTDMEGMTEKEKKLLSELVAVMKKYRGKMFPELPAPEKKKGKKEGVPKAMPTEGGPGDQPSRRLKVQGSGAPREAKTEVKPVEEKKEGPKKEKEPEKEEEKELLKVRVSKYIPQFITSHGKFGPYEDGAEVSLPKEVCNVLVKKGYIEVVE